jgi:hypothetical protein
MKRKRILFSVLAVLTLAVFTLGGCNTGFTDADTQADQTRTLNATIAVQDGDLSDTTWLITRLGDIGVSKIDFDSATTAVGFFVDTTHDFTYSYDSENDTYSLVETGIANPPGPWEFTVDGNSLTFIHGFGPYDTGNPVFEKITYLASATLSSLADTNWLAIGPRGLSLLDNITQVANAGVLDGSFGADPTESFGFTYTYDDFTETGEGTLFRGAGDFITSDEDATMYFPDFWGHYPVTFYLFTK